MSIQSVATVGGLEQQLDWLLIDCVNSGASIGFIAPITQVEARNYWQTVDQGLQTGERLLLVKLVDKQLAGQFNFHFAQRQMVAIGQKLKNSWYTQLFVSKA
ncbi:TPA: hypothetical protein ACK1JA_004388 [Providencia stuartii]